MGYMIAGYLDFWKSGNNQIEIKAASVSIGNNCCSAVHVLYIWTTCSVWSSIYMLRRCTVGARHLRQTAWLHNCNLINSSPMGFMGKVCSHCKQTTPGNDPTLSTRLIYFGTERNCCVHTSPNNTSCFRTTNQMWKHPKNVCLLGWIYYYYMLEKSSPRCT